MKIKNINKSLQIPEYSKHIKPAFHLFIINIDFNNLKKNKNHFIKYLVQNKILAQQHYIPIYKFKVYKESRKSFVGSEKFFKRSVSLPIYVNLKKIEQNMIIKKIKKYFE